MHKQIPKKKNMAVMASHGPSPNFPSLRFGLTAPQPSRLHHAQSLLDPSFYFMTQECIMFSESHPEQATSFSRRDDERRHAVGSLSVLALRLYLATCKPS